MNESTIILIIVGVVMVTLGAGVLAAVLMSNRKMKQWDKRAEDLKSGLSVLNFYGVNLLLNEKGIQEYDMHKGEIGNIKKRVSLPPGNYESIGTYSFRAIKEKKNFIAETVKLDFVLEPGVEYDLGVYFDRDMLKFSVAHIDLDDPKFPEGYYASCMKKDA